MFANAWFKRLLLLATHGGVGFIGFALGIYMLPILTAPDSPSDIAMMQKLNSTEYVADVQRDLKDSDFLHWGEGKLRIGSDFIAFDGELAPGPDYILYLSPEFVETEADFNRLKSTMMPVGNIKTFDRFILPLDESVNLEDFTTAIVWCESFGQFITAAQFRNK